MKTLALLLYIFIPSQADHKLAENVWNGLTPQEPYQVTHINDFRNVSLICISNHKDLIFIHPVGNDPWEDRYWENGELKHRPSFYDVFGFYLCWDDCITVTKYGKIFYHNQRKYYPGDKPDGTFEIRRGPPEDKK